MFILKGFSSEYQIGNSVSSTKCARYAFSIPYGHFLRTIHDLRVHSAYTFDQITYTSTMLLAEEFSNAIFHLTVKNAQRILFYTHTYIYLYVYE
jgi:hypothetical protein